MDPQLIRAIESAGEPNWTAVVQAVGAVAAVVVGVLGFLFVWFQIRGLKQALHSDTHSKIYTEDFEILKLFVDKPHLRPYFYDNVEVMSGSADEAAVQTIAEMWCCHFEHVMLQLDNLPKFIRQSWLDYARYMTDCSPAIRACFKKLRNKGLYIAAQDSIMYGGGVPAPNQALQPTAAAIPVSPSSTV